MEERHHRTYSREEEFLDEFYSSASAAAKLLKGEWDPNDACSDATRRNQDYFRTSGEPGILFFDSAAVYHNEQGFSSVQIILKSSMRVVAIRVRPDGNNLIAEKIVDKKR